jgi:hypothetical protein
MLASSVLPQSRAVSDKQLSQERAENVGDLILQRFHESRDFAPIFKEFFVSDLRMRQREIELVFGRRLPRYRDHIDRGAVERAYIALSNFWYLLSTYRFAHDEDLDVPREIESAYGLMQVDLEQISTGKELDEKFTNKMDNFLDVLRKHIPQEVFKSDTYKLNVARFKEEEETADVEQMRRDFGLSKETEIYVVKREFFNYFLVHEADSMKVFTISLRTKRRL